MTTQQPEALRLADEIDDTPDFAVDPNMADEIAAELRRLHAENGTLRHKLQTLEELGDAGDDVQLLRMGYAAARLEIASLRAQPVAAPGVPSDHDALRCAVGNCKFNGEVAQHAQNCEAPNVGWRCTRTLGHDGPCAAVESPEDKDFVERGMRRIRDAEDAGRYRLLKRGQHWSVIDGMGNTLRAEVLDAAVDAAIAAQQGGANG